MAKTTSKNKIYNFIFVAVIAVFFFTPVGYESKIMLNKLVASSAQIIPQKQRDTIRSYNWELKDENWNFFNFSKSKGKVIFVNFWLSWKVPSVAELYSIEKLYADYKDKVDFYVLSNEERGPVDTLFQKRGFTMPMHYLILDKPMPFDAKKVPSTYIIAKDGTIAVAADKIKNWNSDKVRTLLDELLEK